MAFTSREVAASPSEAFAVLSRSGDVPPLARRGDERSSKRRVRLAAGLAASSTTSSASARYAVAGRHRGARHRR